MERSLDQVLEFREEKPSTARFARKGPQKIDRIMGSTRQNNGRETLFLYSAEGVETVSARSDRQPLEKRLRERAKLFR